MTTPCDILLIDDDVLSQYMVEDVVTQMGHRFHCAADGESGREALAASRFSLVILDRRLPDTDGLLLAQAIQTQARSPFIIFSQLSSPNDQALGLGMGALDYICKPVEPIVLRARIEKHLAVERDTSEDTVLVVANALRLNTLTRRLWVNGHMEVMSPAETRLLACLIRHLGEPLDRVLISKAICKREWVYGDRTVDVLVSRLRRRLRDSAVQIVTIHGMGYILTNDEAA